MEDLPKRKITLANDLFFNEVNTYLRNGQLVTISVSGGSMQPFLKHGDIVTLKPLADSDLKLGHIVLAIVQKRYMLHRIIKISDEEIWLAGDANLQQIEYITVKDILAVMIEAKRDNITKDLYSFHMLLAAKLWFLGRPLRRVYNKLIK